ncbi:MULTISPECIES: MBL fold metallo-hydrolase [Ensifer]|jgi:glyoxylase-like metal-dependent hydrolase (beta-lactamase superfamily II)|uniref:MBL fold metallo-hydrolase n=1 Tax=Ensifer canadensis TaxID=555315 RepID=A0AAW4FFI8_9HYPH|nr:MULTISPECIES: MBL fold metallo-hydrolase [Ensifer]MDP9628109.1 glyoxylase-like metal-dependent hydrolase (beta-lactamase superfamily II) [Ensifer adhaerens]KQU72251.1 MBL fold metallo-hydrolase [Ensifer sp. Root31]KQY71675.1 MBL fold metallo-hydrolase [Ensifer sp. Root142]MBD9486910.1 MBL fold metallo-hydrolase [Ensifer sp. ENS11]MBM3090788.1 MBL fold metallo-hydrolase [Ensifer canadensis]
MQGPDFDLDFKPAHGEAVTVADGVQRITVNNPGPFTFHGTNSYIVGNRSVAVIDPGPEDEAHFQALMSALRGREVTHIAVSHTHRDHSPLARRLKAATGAAIVGEGPHRAARPLHEGEINPFAESSDMDFSPDIILADGGRIEGDGWALTGLATPGHTANHMAFALDGTGTVFSADHVMAWATTIVAPPDGAMADYMASLEKLLMRDDRLYLPGHGGPVIEPASFLRGLRAHRRMRERAVLERVRAGDGKIPDMVKVIYASTDTRLHGAAALSVLAHLEDLVEQGRVETDGPPSLFGDYRLAPGGAG